MLLKSVTFIIAVVCGAFVPHAVLADHAGFGFHAPHQQVSVGEWFTFSPPKAPFSVTLPAMPTEKGKDRKSRVNVNNYGLKALSSEYLVMWATGLPAGSSGRDSLDSFFPVALKQTLEMESASGLSFQVLYEKELVLDGNCGREAKMRTWPRFRSHEIWARGYVVGSDLVALIVLYPDEEEASAEAGRFFDSLTLLRTGQEIAPTDVSEQSLIPGADGAPTVDNDPLPLSRPRPDYTESARADKIQGLVKLRVLVNREGDVREAWIRSHLPDGLDEEAIRSVRAVKFKPATKDGKPVAAWVNMEVDFRLPR